MSINCCPSRTFDRLSVTKVNVAPKQTSRSLERNKHTYPAQHHGTAFQFTVVLPLNQGSLRKNGRNLFSGSFFGSFLDNLSRYNREQKRTKARRRRCGYCKETLPMPPVGRVAVQKHSFVPLRAFGSSWPKMWFKTFLRAPSCLRVFVVQQHHTLS